MVGTRLQNRTESVRGPLRPPQTCSTDRQTDRHIHRHTQTHPYLFMRPRPPGPHLHPTPTPGRTLTRPGLSSAPRRPVLLLLLLLLLVVLGRPGGREGA